MGGAFSKLVTGAVDATNAGIDAVVGLSTGVVVTAASKTPILKGIVKPNVHWYANALIVLQTVLIFITVDSGMLIRMSATSFMQF